MHDLFMICLTKRDLCRAGELFSVADSDIVNSVTDVLTEIETIISHPDYLQNKNDQSVMEICLTRITSCIRETKSVERHCSALVGLLNSCLKYNLQSSGNEEPPHAKISADLISSIFLNYNKKSVMEMALPVAVKILQKGNRELSKNLASYLSLAAIEYAYLLSPHIQQILDSIVIGNHGLCQILPQIYDVSPEALDKKVGILIPLLKSCETQEKLALLSLFSMIVKKNPGALENCINQICETLNSDSNQVVTSTMNLLLKLAEEFPTKMLDQFPKIKAAAEKNPSTISIASQILSTAGKINRTRAQFALDFVLQHLPQADRTSQTILLREATLLCSTYPVLFNEKVLACVRQKNNLNSAGLATTTESSSGSITTANAVTTTTAAPSVIASQQAIVKPCKNSKDTSLYAPHATNGAFTHSTTTTTTSGGVTIVKLNVAQPATHIESSHVEKGTGVLTIPPATANNATNGAVVSPPHTGYTRRAKLGDSRSTGRLHSAGNTHRSMTRLNIAGGSVGGLHKSMTRLSSSQQINNAIIGSTTSTNHSSGNLTTQLSCNLLTNGSTAVNNPNYVAPVPPLSNNVIITGHNKWGIPSTKITSGGVTVTTSPSRSIRTPHSILSGSSGGLGSLSSCNNNYSIANGNSSCQSYSINNSVSVHHASPASPTSSSVMTLPVNAHSNFNNQVSVSGPVTVTSRRNDNTSVTLINASSSNSQRMSVFEPCPERDTIQHFSEKHYDKIKTFIDNVEQRLPPAAKCTIEERRAKKFAKLHFACQMRGPHCLYSKTFFTMRTRNPKTWIHLMFLDQQARAGTALSSRDPAVSSLRHCWDILKCENKSFVTLATSAFPPQKDIDAVVNELRHSGYFDVFELGAMLIMNNNDSSSNGKDKDSEGSTESVQMQWGCWLCNHPEKAMGFLQGNTQPVIEGQLKEKKGKWRLFRRWRTRYFTLSGAHLSCKGSSGGESIDINQIRSLKVSRGARNIPKAFEIFTGDQTLILKPKDGKNAEEWVQCLSIVVAHARDNPTNKTNSLPARGLGNSRTAF